MNPNQLLHEYVNVINCGKCRQDNITSILNDGDMNIPQPGFIGKYFTNKRVLFVDRNPGSLPIENSQISLREVQYMRCLRDIGRGEETNTFHEDIRSVFKNYFTKHHVYKEVFQRTKLTLDDVAIFNVVKCRTFKNQQPQKTAFKNCIEMHFAKWINMLSPKIIVSFGKAPFDQIENEAKRQNVEIEFINRERSLNKSQRELEINKIVLFIVSVKG